MTDVNAAGPLPLKAMPTSPLRSIVTQSIPLWVLAGGHVFASLFLRELSLGLDHIEDPGLLGIVQFISGFYHWTNHWLKPVVLVLMVFLQIRILRGRSVQSGQDLLGGLLCLRCLFLFVTMNLLLMSRLKADGMLLWQLVLFIPVVTLNFGWLYWRLDSSARSAGRRHIRFENEAEDPVSIFDYFHASSMALHQFEPKGASPTSRLMKTLFMLHGAVMLDLVALTLSRAIALASGG